MDLKLWRNQIIQQERLNGGKMVRSRRAYNKALQAGGSACGVKHAFHIDTQPLTGKYDVDKAKLASFVQDQDGIVMIYANWCPASQAYKTYLEQLNLPLVMYDVASQSSMDCNCKGKQCNCIGVKRFGVPLADGVQYYPTVFFLDGERSRTFDVPKKDKESLATDYEMFKQGPE